MTHPRPHRHVVPTTVLTRSRLVPLNAARPVTIVVSQTKVQHQRPTKHGVNKAHSPIRRPINLRPSPKNSNFHQKVTTVKANQGNPHQALKDKGVINSGCSRHMIRNISYLSDIKEINGGYVAFRRNLKGGKIIGKDTECVVLSSNFKLPDENHVLLRVSRENNMYNVDLKNIVPSGDLTYLFVKATLDESNLWHRRKNRTLIEAARTMLADLLLPFPFGLRQLILPGIQDNFNAGKIGKEPVSTQQYVLLPLWSTGSKDPQNLDADAAFANKENESEVHVSPRSSDKPKKPDEKVKKEAKGKNLVDVPTGVRDLSDEFEEFFVNSTNRVNAASTPVTAVGPNLTNNTNNFNAAGPSNTVVSLTFEIGGKSSFVDPSQYLDDLDMPALEDIIYSDDEEDVVTEADFSNLETNITVSPILKTRVYKDHHVTQIIGDLSLAPQTRSMGMMVKEQDLPKGKRAIGSKWVFRNKKDERGIVIKNKARLVTQGHTQEEDIDYEEVFASATKIEAILLFLAYASFMGFMVYQVDVKSAFLYETSEEEVYVCQPTGFKDPDYPDKVYKVVKALYGLHQALRAWYETLANYILENGFQRGRLITPCSSRSKQKPDGIFISQDKYVAKILKKFGLKEGKSATTPIDTKKPLLKDLD
nr:putative ribonuclease H-like domain-containing protein [Tanacetum cinerariifolium]